MNFLYRTAIGLFALSSLSFSLAAQEPEKPLLTQLAAVTASTSAPLVLDIVVTGKSGKPALGLGQQDFTVLDNGQPTKILSFLPATPPPPPSQVDATTLIILVFDEINAPYNAATTARDQAALFLKQNQGQLTHPVSLAFFNDKGLQIQTRPSVDGSALAAALKQQNQTIRIDQRGTGFYGAEDRLKKSMDAMDSLIAQESKSHVRKMVIWISPGWPLLSGERSELSASQMQDTFHSVVKLSTALREAHITLYSIDSLGTAGVGESQSSYYENFTKALTTPHNAQLGSLGLQVLSTQTGGRAIFGNEMIQNSINHCISDLDSIYTLTIAPAPADNPNQFHELTIKLAPPGLKARTRNGYYAQP